jgi:hypothetical protein
MNGDGTVSTTDIIYLALHLFSEGPEPADPLVRDSTCDGEISLLDVVVLVDYVLRGGPEPCNTCIP